MEEDKTKEDIKKILLENPEVFDETFLDNDIANVRRTKNIRLVPYLKNRVGGKISYGEWCHVIGIFQTLMNISLDKKEDNKVLDVGCGTGILGIAAEPFLGRSGGYTGIDVLKRDIEFCKNHYDSGKFNFIHLDVYNASYADTQKKERKAWPIKDETKDLVTALSVWTHFDEEDAVHYLKEVSRVLKRDGKALITFFILDEIYDKNISEDSEGEGRFHRTDRSKWIFKNKSYNSEDWYHPDWVEKPEDAIALTENALRKISKDADLEVMNIYPGNWKETPGVFFQDVVVFRKK